MHLSRPQTLSRAHRPLAARRFPHLPNRPYSAPAATPEAALVRAEAGLTFLELNRPAAKNALSVALVDSLRQAVEDVRFDGFGIPFLSPSLRG